MGTSDESQSCHCSLCLIGALCCIQVDEAGLEQSQALIDQLALLKRDNAHLSRQNEELKKRVEELGHQLQVRD